MIEKVTINGAFFDDCDQQVLKIAKQDLFLRKKGKVVKVLDYIESKLIKGKKRDENSFRKKNNCFSPFGNFLTKSAFYGEVLYFHGFSDFFQFQKCNLLYISLLKLQCLIYYKISGLLFN